MPEHIAVIVNPASGLGRGAAAGDAVIARLRERGAEVRSYRGVSAEETTALAAQALAEAPDAFVVVGGDGTLSQVLDAVVGSGIRVALAPAGTGNDLARMFDLPRDDPAAAAELVLDGEVLAVDVGIAEGAGWRRHFMTIVAIGLDSLISERVNSLKWPRGQGRYYLGMAIEFARLRALRFSLAVDGGAEEEHTGLLLAIGNTSSYGGGLRMCPDADATDGRLEVSLVGAIGRVRLLALFPRIFSGRHVESPHVQTRRASSVRVDAGGLAIYADGERLGAAPAMVGLERAAVPLCVPRGAAAERRG